MKIKTIQSLNISDLDFLVNTFESSNDCRATHTHVTVLDNKLVYTAVVFFVEKK